MMGQLLFSAVVLLLAGAAKAAFVSQSPTRFAGTVGLSTAHSMTPIDMVSPGVVVESIHSGWNNIMLATVDSDIAKLSDNEFAPVFMGGIAVMFGGLLSALFVGFIVNSKDLSASLVADSYAQSEDDEEFWKGLSEEEKNKAQALLKRVKEAKGDASASATSGIAEEPAAQQAEEISNPEALVESSKRDKIPVPSPTKLSGKNVGMFDDYEE